MFFLMHQEKTLYRIKYMVHAAYHMVHAAYHMVHTAYHMVHNTSGNPCLINYFVDQQIFLWITKFNTLVIHLEY